MSKRVLEEQRIIISFPEYDGAGIYIIKNVTTGKVYVGSSRHIRQRAKAHDLSFRNGTCNQKFLEDIHKGHKFVCEVVEKYSKITRYELRDKEEYYARKYKAHKDGYNTACVPTYNPQLYANNQNTLDWIKEKM